MTKIKSNHVLSLSDAQLLELSVTGDEQAFGQIVERYQSLVCSVALNRCGDLALSEDLAQEAFIVAWQKLAELRDAARFKAWICTIVSNLASRTLRRRGHRIASDLESIPDVAATSKSPLEHAVSAEEQTLVGQALAKIPENYREPLILFYREDQSVARVAEALDLSQDAVKQRLSRGRKMVEEHLTATVESVLTLSKPGQRFTAAVLAGVAGLSAKSATAAVAQGGVSLGQAAASTGGAANGLGSLWLGPLLQLPVLAWLYTTSYADMRTDQERILWRRFNLGMLCSLMVFALAAFSFAWWQGHVQPVWLRGLVIPGMMVVYMIPLIVFSRRFGKQIENLRRAEGRFTPPQPLAGTEFRQGTPWKTRMAFGGSGLMVIAWPVVLPFVAGDWWVVAAMLAGALLVGSFSAQLCLRYPRRSVQLYAGGIALTLLAAIAVMVWRGRIWQASFANYLLWYAGALQASAITMAILTTVAWKRVHGQDHHKS